MFNFFRPAKKITFSKSLLNDLYRYAVSLTQQADQAYDLVQTCCEKTLNKEIEADKLRSYMMRIIRNEFIDHYRRHKLSLVVGEQLQEQQDFNEQGGLQQLESILIDKQHVALILEQVSNDERELLYLWAVQGFSMQEIALQTNTPRGTLLARLSRLKKRLNNDFAHLAKEIS